MIMVRHKLDSGPEIQHVINAFLKHKAVSTQKKYKQIFDEWQNFLTENRKDILTATKADVLKFLDWEGERPAQKYKDRIAADKVTPATVAKKAHILSKLYRFLMVYELAPKNPFASACEEFHDAAQGDRRPIDMVPLDRVAELLDLPSAHTKEGICIRALLALLAGLGLRIQESLNIKICDIKANPNGGWCLQLHATKNKTSPTLPLNPWVFERVQALIKQRKVDDRAREGDPLIVLYRVDGSTEGKAIVQRTALRWLKKHYSDMGLPASLGCHSLRATAISALLAKGCDHRQVQEFSRHGSVKMVELYDKRRMDPAQHPAFRLTYK